MKNGRFISGMMMAVALGFGVAPLLRAEEPSSDTAPRRLTPVQLTLCVPIQAAPEDWDVAGLRLNLVVARNHDVWGLDFGVLNLSTGRQAGVQVGFAANEVEGNMYGIQAAILVNEVETGKMYGVQVGGINYVSDAAGLQVGLLGNSARNHMQGMQIGLFNHANHLQGMQIGLLNINRSAPWPILPLLNLGFAD